MKASKESNKEILNVIKELVKADSIKTGEVIDTWLPNQQKEVVNKLESDIDLQLKYLQDFLTDRVEEIRKIVLTPSKSHEMSEEAKSYKNFLNLHIKLLAEKESPELKEVVMKDYYPIDTLDGIKDNSLIVTEARAYLKKRSEMFSESLKLFLPLMEQLSLESIELDAFGAKASKKEGYSLSFNQLFEEICDILIKSTGRPDSSDALWNDTLKTLFKIANKNNPIKSDKKRNAVNKILYDKIALFLETMSKYI